MMILRQIGFVIGLLCAWVAPAYAQGPPAPAPAPGAECLACNDLALSLAALRSDLESLLEQRRRQSDAEASDPGFDIIWNEFVRNAQSRNLTKDPTRLKELDEQREDLLKASRDLRRQHEEAQNKTQALIDLLRGMIVDRERELAECNKEKCSRPPGGTGTGTTGTATGGGGTTACSSCDAVAESIEKLEAELSDLRERIAGLERNIPEVEVLKAGATGNQAQALDGQLKLMQGRLQEAVRQQSEKTKELGDLKKKLEDCGKCDTQPKKTSQLFQGPWPYGIAGLGAAALFIGRGGDTPTLIASTPVIPQQPTTTTNPTPPAQPAPPVQPMPDVIDLVMGLYLLQSCVCEFDQGGHDAFLRLCQSVRQFRLVRTGANSASIDGDAPLIRGDFIIDANGQTIDGTARGSVGVLRYTGSFGPGGSVTLFLNYDIANTAIRYRVTATKQP